MDAVRTILERLEATPVAAMAPNERHTIAVEPHAELAIEKVAPARLSVGHRADERADRRTDPEVVFRTERGAWVPIAFRKRPSIRRYDATGIDRLAPLAAWNRRLRECGFVAAAGDDG